MDGNQKAQLDSFGLYTNDDKTAYNLVTIYRDPRATTLNNNSIKFNNAESGLETNKRHDKSGLNLNFEGTGTFKRFKADDVFHYDNVLGKVMKSLSVTTPVNTKVDINAGYTPNTTIEKI